MKCDTYQHGAKVCDAEPLNNPNILVIEIVMFSNSSNLNTSEARNLDLFSVVFPVLATLPRLAPVWTHDRES